MPKLFTVKETADVLRVSEQTVRSYIKAGTLPVVNRGTADRPRYLVSEKELEGYIAQRASSSENVTQ